MVFQLKWYCSTGVRPRGAQVRQRWGRWLNPLSSMNTIVRPSFLAFFLTPASASASTARSSLRPALAPVRWAVGNSIPVGAEFARRGRRGSETRTLSRSNGRPAPTSTDRSRIPELAALAAGRVRCVASPPDAGVLCVLLVPPASVPAIRLPPAAAPNG